MANSLNALPQENAAPQAQPPQAPSRKRLDTIIDKRLAQTPEGDKVAQGANLMKTVAATALPQFDAAFTAIEALEQTEYGAQLEDMAAESLEQESEEPEAIEPMGIFTLFLLLGPALVLDLIDLIDLVLEAAGVATAGTVSVVWGIISLGLDILGSIGMGVLIWLVGDAYLKSNLESLKKLGKTLLWAIRIGIVVFGIGDDVPVIEALPLEALSVLCLYVASHFLSREEINARAQKATETVGRFAGQAAEKHNASAPRRVAPTAPSTRESARITRRESATPALNRFLESAHA